MSEEKNLHREAQDAILKRIIEQVPVMKAASDIRALAEAYAWVEYPNQSHGGDVSVK
ncbi:hypothetical protein USB125703_02053 [Pseudoclavibacter triregionum]|nr:hypothetical protein USB125703_02053 [Pseudoclavibacter triregionum]